MAETFICSSAAAGIAIIAPATGGGHPTLINPQSSTVRLDVKKLTLTYVSGNNAPGGVEWAYTLNVGTGIGPTGAPILTATRGALVQNATIGAPTNPRFLYWSPTVNTFTAAPVIVAGTGLSLFTGVAATAVAPFPLVANYEEGELSVYPGAAISLCTNVATTTALFQVALWVTETDL